MKAPESLRPLLEQGLIEDVLRPLRSGKEAQVYLVLSQGEERVAKVYKEQHERSFKNRSQYTEGRTTRNTRDQRAMQRQSRYGRAQDEAAWRSTEADIIYRLRAADVRVPEPYAFSDNVLIMALVRDRDGQPAKRLADMQPTAAEARVIFDQLLAETVKMLCAGVVHGDLSEFNVLMGASGAVVIDFPQAVDPAKNNNARRILLRDVGNLERFLARHQRGHAHTRYGQEMWDHFEKQTLSPDTRLTGRAPRSTHKHEANSLLAEMLEMERAAKERRAALGLPPPRPARAPVFSAAPVKNERKEGSSTGPTRKRSRRGRGSGQTNEAGAPSSPPGARSKPSAQARGQSNERGASSSPPGASPPGSKPSAQARGQSNSSHGSHAAAPENKSESTTSERKPSRRRRRGRRRGAKTTPGSEAS